MQRFTQAALLLTALASILQAAQPPDPDFAPLGGSFGQTMRLLVSAAPPDPCVVMVGLHPLETAPPDPTGPSTWRLANPPSSISS